MINIVIIIVLILVIIFLVKARYIQHKFYAVLIIAFLLFFYISASKVISDNDVNIESFDGVILAGKLYVGWLGQVFQNSKALVGNALNLDWQTNTTIKSKN